MSFSIACDSVFYSALIFIFTCAIPAVSGASLNASEPRVQSPGPVNPGKENVPPAGPAPSEPAMIGWVPPGGPTADSCSPTSPCTNSHSECIDGRCLCNEGYALAENDTCVKMPELGEPCRLSGLELRCSGFGVEISCPQNGSAVCGCKTGYEPAGRKACKQAVRGLGAACKVDGDCTAAFATCQGGKCACIQGFKAGGKDGLCVPTEHKCLGNAKVLEQDGQPRMCQVQMNLRNGEISNDTCPPGSVCFYWQNSYTANHALVGHCCPKPPGPNVTVPCPVGVEHKTGKCIDYSRFPADAPLPPNLGPLCPVGTGYDCYAGQTCCPAPCLSSSSHFNYAGRCYDTVILDEPCEIDAQCLPDSQCKGGTCQCVQGYKKSTSTLCEPPGGFNPPGEAQPPQLGAPEQPSPSPSPSPSPPVGTTARPSSTSGPPPTPGRSLAAEAPPPVGGGFECGENKPCSDPRTTCMDGLCLCGEGYSPDGNGTCAQAPRLGEPCNVNGLIVSCYGFGVESICPENGTVCVCKGGYAPGANKACAPEVHGVGDPCASDSDCTVAFAVCKGGKCACIDGFKPAGNVCAPTEYHCLGNDKALQKGGQVVKCQVVQTILGDFTNDTCPAGHVCNYWQQSYGSVQQTLVGHCCPKPTSPNVTVAACPVGIVHKTHKCPDYSNLPADAPLPADSGPLCPLGQGYDCHQGRLCCPVACSMSSSHFNVDGRCYDTVLLDEPCQVGPQCMPGAECRKTCQCRQGYTKMSSTSCVPNEFVPAPSPPAVGQQPPVVAPSAPSRSVKSGSNVDTPPGSADGQSCSAAKPCPDPQRTCIDGVCLCAEGLTPGEKGTCVKTWAELGETCRGDGKEMYCRGFGVEPNCPSENVCACEAGHEPAQGNTCKIAMLAVGAICKVDGDCTVAFARCAKGKCACINGFKADANGFCQPTEYNCVGTDEALQEGGKVRTCVVHVTDGGGTESDTCPSSHFCNYWQNTYTTDQWLTGHCCPKPAGTNQTWTCPVGVVNTAGKCPDLSSIPADAPLPPEMGPLCPSAAGYECLRGGACCPLPCLSSSSHFHVAGRCYDHVILDQPCDIDAQCLPRSECRNGICKCKQGYVQQSSTLCMAPGGFLFRS